MSRRREPLVEGPVDVHGHAIPTQVLERNDPVGPRIVTVDGVVRVELPGATRSAPAVPGLFEADLGRRLAWMDDAGIAAQVLSPYVSMSASLAAPQRSRRGPRKT